MPENLWDYRVEGHRPSMHSVGWGEPQTISAACSCGWKAPTVQEKWFTDEEKEFSYFAEPWRTVARTYGPDQTLRPGQVYGSRETAIKLILDHLAYDPVADLARAESLFKSAASYATSVESGQALRSAEQVMETAEELEHALQRARIWHDVEFPSLPILIPEARRIIEDHEAAQRRESEARANTPLTEAEKQVLRDSGIQI